MMEIPEPKFAVGENVLVKSRGRGRITGRHYNLFQGQYRYEAKDGWTYEIVFEAGVTFFEGELETLPKSVQLERPR